MGYLRFRHLMILLPAMLAVAIALLTPEHTQRAPHALDRPAFEHTHASATVPLVSHSHQGGGAHDHSHNVSLIGDRLAGVTLDPTMMLWATRAASMRPFDVAHLPEQPPKV